MNVHNPTYSIVIIGPLKNYDNYSQIGLSSKIAKGEIWQAADYA